MGLATVCTIVVCGLLLVYLAAYAHVTRLGIDQAGARGQLRRNRLQNEMLQAERDRLQSPSRIIGAATALGMTERGSIKVEYVPQANSLPANFSPANSLPVNALPARQEYYGGTTADSRTAASLDH